MSDNAQFIYGKLIKIHREGLLVYALISLNQQAICSAWKCSCCRAIFLLFTCDPLDPDFNTCKWTERGFFLKKKKLVLVILKLPVHTVNNRTENANFNNIWATVWWTRYVLHRKPIVTQANTSPTRCRLHASPSSSAAGLQGVPWGHLQ